jgi:hypothetical protein
MGFWQAQNTPSIRTIVDGPFDENGGLACRNAVRVAGLGPLFRVCSWRRPAPTHTIKVFIDRILKSFTTPKGFTPCRTPIAMHAFALAFLPHHPAILEVFRPPAKAPARPSVAGVAADIPGAFSEDQARKILVLKALGADRAAALRILRGKRQALNGAQLECAAEMLELALADLCATLADAMKPCALRGQLMRRRIIEDAQWIGLRRDTAAALLQNQPLGAGLS